MEATASVRIRLTGRVVLDATHKNTVLPSFANYVNEALQGLRPLISKYQVYDSINNITVPMTVSNVVKGDMYFEVCLVGNITKFTYNTFKFTLQAVLTDGSVVNIATLSASVQSSTASVTVTWVLRVEFSLFTTPGLAVELVDMYNLMVDFFTNSSALTQTSPSVNVTPQPVFESFNGLDFIVLYHNVGYGIFCPVVDMSFRLSLLGVPAFSIYYVFNCVPSPALYNFFELSILITV